jgi:hypothetical protein
MHVKGSLPSKLKVVELKFSLQVYSYRNTMYVYKHIYVNIYIWCFFTEFMCSLFTTKFIFFTCNVIFELERKPSHSICFKATNLQNWRMSLYIDSYQTLLYTTLVDLWYRRCIMFMYVCILTSFHFVWNIIVELVFSLKLFF